MPFYSTPTQLNLVLVVTLVSLQMNGNDAPIISSSTINSTVLLCCAATKGVIVTLQSSVINQAIYVHITPRHAPMCTNRGLCVPTYQYGRTNITIENIPQTRPHIGGQLDQNLTNKETKITTYIPSIVTVQQSGCDIT